MRVKWLTEKELACVTVALALVANSVDLGFYARRFRDWLRRICRGFVTMESDLESHRTRARVRWNSPSLPNRELKKRPSYRERD